MKIKRAVAEEVAKLAAEHGQTLRPTQIVEWARQHEQSALHAHFEWRDDVAGERYRELQAAHLVRMIVTVPEQGAVPVRMFVSAPGDRGTGLYRRTTDVLADDGMRAALIEQFLREMRIFEERYRRIAELAPIFEKLDELRAGRRGKGRAA